MWSLFMVPMIPNIVRNEKLSNKDAQSQKQKKVYWKVEEAESSWQVETYASSFTFPSQK